MVYRAPARACNLCTLKGTCTDSDEGREIVSQPDAWLRSEIGRFHREISLTLCILAALITAVEMARRHARVDGLAPLRDASVGPRCHETDRLGAHASDGWREGRAPVRR